MNNLKRRDFLKFAGIAAACPTILLKSKPLFKKFGKTSMILEGVVNIDSSIIGRDATCGIISNEKEEIIEHWDFPNQEWTIQFDPPLNVNLMRFLDERHYMTIRRISDKDEA